MQTIYNVSIAHYTPPAGQAGLGFIDNTTPAQYLAQAAMPTGFNVSKAQAKVQGNLRWKYITQSFALMANPYISNVVATGAAIDTDATTFSFDVYFERDAAVYTANASGTVLTGSAAVAYAVAAALAITYNNNIEYYDPTTSQSSQNGQAVTADYCDQRVGLITTGALAADAATALSNITVTIVA